VPLGVAVSAVLGELLPKSSIRPALVAEAPISVGGNAVTLFVDVPPPLAPDVEVLLLSVGGNAVTLFVDVPPPLAPDVEALLLSAEGSPGNWYSRVRLFFLSNISS
jgi:hypothetical protein